MAGDPGIEAVRERLAALGRPLRPRHPKAAAADAAAMAGVVVPDAVRAVLAEVGGAELSGAVVLSLTCDTSHGVPVVGAAFLRAHGGAWFRVCGDVYGNLYAYKCAEPDRGCVAYYEAAMGEFACVVATSLPQFLVELAKDDAIAAAWAERGAEGECPSPWPWDRAYMLGVDPGIERVVSVAKPWE